MSMLLRKHLLWFARIGILGVFVLGIAMTGTATAQTPITIDFEAAPGLDGVLGTGDDIPLTECTAISNQFSSLGVIFSLVQGGNPIIATQGPPTAGFQGPSLPIFGIHDSPASSGVNTLTDGFARANSPCPPPFEDDIRADFTTPVSSVSVVVIDFRADGGGSIGNTATLNAFDAQAMLGLQFLHSCRRRT